MLSIRRHDYVAAHAAAKGRMWEGHKKRDLKEAVLTVTDFTGL